MSNPRSIPFARPWINDEDRKAVLEVLNGHILTHGPQCKAFEADFGTFLGEDIHCVSVSSCMAALHLAYVHFGIGPGDEVIVPAQTHVAMAHAVEWVGAKPVFVDCEAATGNLTADNIAAAITSDTKAISVVHFLGIPCAMPEITAVAEKHNLKVIEDCAIALGARYQGKHVGMFGDAGCFSFYPVKHITTGEGGMFVTRHEHVAQAVAKMRAFGVDRSHTERTTPGMYDVNTLGLNYRMSEMQAALGRQQLTKIHENLEQRRVNFIRLNSLLSGTEDISILDAVNKDTTSSHYCLSVVLQGRLRKYRNEIITRLNQSGVGTSIYYPNPVPRMTYYKNKYGFKEDAYPNATTVSDSSIALPVGPHVALTDIEYIAESLKQAMKEVGS